LLIWGYDISPQAFELSKEKANGRLKFKLADFRQEKDTFFDLILILDVIEHLENYYSFLREIKPKGHYKILHIPLDLSVQTVVRSHGLSQVRRSYGHIHYFTKKIALEMLKDVGYDVIDCCYTDTLQVAGPLGGISTNISVNCSWVEQQSISCWAHLQPLKLTPL
jgi:Methyltransferase domain